MNSELRSSLGDGLLVLDSEDSLMEQGRLWRINSGFLKGLTAKDYYYTFNFTAPATGHILYGYVSSDKTGNELFVSLEEGGTWDATGAVTVTMRNLNRDFSDSNPFVVKRGLQAATGNTLAGSTEVASRLMPGSVTGGGTSKPGASAEASHWIQLKAATMYTVKFLAIEAAVTSFAAFLVLAKVDR